MDINFVWHSKLKVGAIYKTVRPIISKYCTQLGSINNYKTIPINCIILYKLPPPTVQDLWIRSWVEQI